MQIGLDGASNGELECGFTVSLTERDSGIDMNLNAFSAFTYQTATFFVPVLDLYKPNHKTLK